MKSSIKSYYTKKTDAFNYKLQSKLIISFQIGKLSKWINLAIMLSVVDDSIQYNLGKKLSKWFAFQKKIDIEFTVSIQCLTLNHRRLLPRHAFFSACASSGGPLFPD